MSKREPKKHVRHETATDPDTGRRVRVNTLKTFWRRDTHVRQKTEQVLSDGTKVTHVCWVPADNAPSLKRYARELVKHAGAGDHKKFVAATNWFYNKGANCSNPPQGIGATRKKKGQKK